MHEDAIVIGGLGVVGTATRRMLGIQQYWDIKGSHAIGPLNTPLHPISDARYIFLCLPTPTVDGKCDLTAIRSYFSGYKAKQIYIIRSTVPPGTAQELSAEFDTHVMSNPEFLTEATADEEAIFTDTMTAEFIKYAVNSFYASKALFANVLYECAEKLGIDYGVVRDAMYARKWVGRNHLTVPWKGKRGVNGRCLPKDLGAFAAFTGHPFFEVLLRLNEEFTK